MSSTCTACQAAQTRPHSPLYHANCRGCKVRALATGPQFWASNQAGALTSAYRAELAAAFGAEGAAEAHTEVKAENARLRALQGKGE